MSPRVVFVGVARVAHRPPGLPANLQTAAGADQDRRAVGDLRIVRHGHWIARHIAMRWSTDHRIAS
jgi:hypothetical protein